MLGLPQPQDEAAYLDVLNQRYGGYASQIAAQYPASKFEGSYTAALTRAVGDQITRLFVARRDAPRGQGRLARVRVQFQRGLGARRRFLKVSHAPRSVHVFGNPLMPTPESQAVSDAMTRTGRASRRPAIRTDRRAGNLAALRSGSERERSPAPARSEWRCSKTFAPRLRDVASALRAGHAVASAQIPEMVRPPSTTRVWPVTYEAASLARKSAAPASSSG